MKIDETRDDVIDAFNQHDTSRLVEHYRDDAVVHDPLYPEPLRGKDAIAKDFDDTFRAFPDIHVHVIETFARDTTGAFEFSMKGTHEGPLEAPSGEIPPTHKRFAVGGSLFSRHDEEGRIVEEHRHYDLANQMKQLGLSF